jgi:hypothetical protein
MPHTGRRRRGSRLRRLSPALTLLGVAAAWLVGAAPGLAAVLPAQTLSLDPGTGGPGTSVTATASGFSSCPAPFAEKGLPATLTFSWDGKEFARSAVDPDTGTAIASFVVPEADPAAPHQVEARCLDNPELTASQGFEVTPPPSPSPSPSPSAAPSPAPAPAPAAPSTSPVTSTSPRTTPATQPVSAEEPSAPWTAVAAGSALLLALLAGGLAGHRAYRTRASHRWVRGHVKVVAAPDQEAPMATVQRTPDDSAPTTAVALQSHIDAATPVVEETKV